MGNPEESEGGDLAAVPSNVQNVQVGSVEDAEVMQKPLPGSVDDAHELFHGQPENFVYTAKEANRVRMKLDFILLPMVRVCLLGS